MRSLSFLFVAFLAILGVGALTQRHSPLPAVPLGPTPAATGGNLCVYVTASENLDEATPLAAENNTRLGFGLVAKAKEAGAYYAYGQWAVTAP